MADVITLTAQPIRITTPPASGTYQPIWAVRDVLDYDILDIEFGLIGLEGSLSSPACSVGVWTSLQKE
jgi:hypothetical protein